MLANMLENIGNKMFIEITMKQWFMLAAVHRSGLEKPKVGDVAEIMGYSRQNVKKIGLQLEKKNFICFEKDKKDSRILRLVRTQKCFQYFQSRDSKEKEFMDNLFKDISLSDLEIVFNSFKKLEDNTKNIKSAIGGEV